MLSDEAPAVIFFLNKGLHCLLKSLLAELLGLPQAILSLNRELVKPTDTGR